MLSLGYKKPFSRSFFLLLLMLLFALSWYAVLIEGLYAQFPPIELNVLAFFLVCILIIAFVYNTYYFPLFVKRKVKWIKDNIGLPMDLEKFIQLTGVSWEWLHQHHVRDIRVDEVALKYLVLLYNDKTDKFYKTQWLMLRMLNLVFDPVAYFIKLEKAQREEDEFSEKRGRFYF